MILSHYLKRRNSFLFFLVLILLLTLLHLDVNILWVLGSRNSEVEVEWKFMSIFTDTNDVTGNLIDEYPQPLNCTSKDIPEGWSIDPIPLDKLRDFCEEKICVIPKSTRTVVQKMKRAILNPVRLQQMKKELDSLNPPDGTIILTLLNAGYLFLFVNFVCGCEARGIKIRDSMLLVTVDMKGYYLARKMGFAVMHSKYIKDSGGFVIGSEAPKEFSGGDYFWLAGMMNVFAADVLSFGYNVLLQDADVTWRHDPRLYLNRPEAFEFDVQAMRDGPKAKPGVRYDRAYNGGFLWYRNNCRVKKYMETLRNLVDWILWVRTDQQVVNRLLTDSHFKGLKIHQLDSDLFVNGIRWDPWRKKPNRPLPLNGLVWHASWTHNHFLKMTKFLVIGEWHISTCRWYDPNLIPDFNFTKELQVYGKDEFGHTEEILEELLRPHWAKSVR